MIANIPTGLTQAQAVELAKIVRHAVDQIRYELPTWSGIGSDGTDMELSHILYREAVKLSPKVLPVNAPTIGELAIKIATEGLHGKAAEDEAQRMIALRHEERVAAAKPAMRECGARFGHRRKFDDAHICYDGHAILDYKCPTPIERWRCKHMVPA